VQRWQTIAIALVLLLTTALGAALTLTRRGATPADGGDGRIALTLGVGYDVQWITPLQELCDRFAERHPRVRATVVGIPGNFYDKVLVMMAGRTAPDLMWMGQGFGQFASRGAFLDVEDVFDFDPEDYYRQVVKCYRFDGRLKGFPFAGDLGFIVYNVDMFEAAGIDPPRDDWTLEEFRRTARSVTKRDADGNISCWGYLGILDAGAFGAFLLSDDMSRHRVDDPAWIDYFNLSLAMRDDDRSTPDQEAAQFGGTLTNRQQFMRGRAAMILDNSYNLPRLREGIDDFRWDIVAMPRGVRSSCIASTQGFAIWRHTPHSKESVQLLQFLVSPEAQRRLWDLGVPSHRPTARQYVRQIAAPPKRRNVILQSMEFLNPAPRHPRLYELKRAEDEAAERIFEKLVTPQAAMRQLSLELDKILNRRYVWEK
jgi:multiple sugar transport system substrate-binding protein